MEQACGAWACGAALLESVGLWSLGATFVTSIHQKQATAAQGWEVGPPWPTILYENLNVGLSSEHLIYVKFQTLETCVVSKILLFQLSGEYSEAYWQMI